MDAAAAPDATNASLSSGKGHRDENFPVASWLVKPEHRAPVLAFYRFARKADDVADHPSASADDRLARLAAMRAGLDGRGGDPEALALREVQAARGIDSAHAHELLDAFEHDVTVHRYPDWDALIGYCRLSAMPVGRYVLDVHGESRATWAGNDALCAALQIVNHLQDCGKDCRALGRVYLPLDLLAGYGATPEELGANRSSPALLAAIRDAAARTRDLLNRSRSFAGEIRDARLAAEVRVIQALAEDLCARLLRRDPLADRVHHRKWEAAAIALPALATGLLPARARRR